MYNSGARIDVTFLFQVCISCQMEEEGNGDNPMGLGGTSNGTGSGSAGGGDLSNCSASPEETVQNFLEQVSFSYSSFVICF